MHQFGDFVPRCDALRATVDTTVVVVVEAAAAAAPSDPVVAQTRDASGETVWDLVRARVAEGLPVPATWGDLCLEPWADRFATSVALFVADAAPMAFPFTRPVYFVQHVTDAIRDLPVIPEAPLLPLLRLINDSRLLGTPHHHTIASFAREREPAGTPVRYYVPMGLTPALCVGAFGRCVSVANGTSVSNTWACSDAVALYARWMGVPADLQRSGGRAAQEAPSGHSPERVRAEWCSTALADAAWSERTAKVCGALHRLAVALSASTGADPAVIPLAAVAVASEEARDVVMTSVRARRAHASAAVAEVATDATGTHAPGRLTDAWTRVRMEDHLAAIAARRSQTDGVAPIEDVSVETRRVEELYARIMPLMTSIRGRCMVTFAQSFLSSVTDEIHDILQRMNKGSLAVAAAVNACLTEQWDALDQVTRRSTLLAGGPEGGPTEGTGRKPRDMAHLSAALSELATCHPLALAADDAPLDAIRVAMQPTQFEREMLARMWAAFERITDAMSVCLCSCVFTRADAALLETAGDDIPADLFVRATEPDAPRIRVRARYVELVRECVDRCRRARATAAEAARPSPPPPPHA